MNAWPDTDGRTIARYLGQLRLRCSTSPIYYRQALRTFQEVVIRDQRTPGQLGREVLETWLREYAMHWPMATLLHRARIVNRFLDFLVGEALIVSNPIADLRAEYHAKSDKAIVRSLLAPDPDQALEALRQFPPFGSVLGDLMRNHIALMQARGYRYQTQGSLVLAVRSLLAGASGVGGRVGIDHVAALGNRAINRQPCRRMRKARSCLGQGTASSRSQHQTKASGSPSCTTGRATLASALYLQPGRGSPSPRHRSDLPLSTLTVTADHPLHHAGPDLLRGIAAGRTRTPEPCRCRSSGRHDYH